jgi:hypothetical protein
MQDAKQKENRVEENARRTLLVADELDMLLQRRLVPFDAPLAAEHHVHLRWAENLPTTSPAQSASQPVSQSYCQ